MTRISLIKQILSSRFVHSRFLLNWPDKDNSGKGNRAFALSEFVWVVGVVGDQIVTFVGVQCAVSLGVIEGQGLVVFEGREPLAPLCYGKVVSDPNFEGLGVEFVAQTQREDFVAFVKKVMGIGIALWISVVRGDEMRESVVLTQDMVRHAGNIA